jgi:tRNA(Arg) A34 adenosine deaminase TadA
MEQAIELAKRAQRKGDYAIGAVIVKDDAIVAISENRSKQDENPVAHAEALAIIEATKKYKSRHLSDCILYTTHEPCPMCASLCVFARLAGVVYGARINDMADYSAKNANGQYLWRTIDISCEEVIKKSGEPIEVIRDFMRDECVQLFHNAQAEN